MLPVQDPRYESLRLQLDGSYRDLAGAETPDQYQAIYDRARVAAQTAGDVQFPDLAFRSWTLMAVSALAIATSPDVPDHEAWLMRAYQALLTAGDQGASTLPRDWLVPFAAVTADIYEEMSTHYWTDDQKAEVEQWGRRLAHASEAIIPIELADQQNPARTSEIARRLADLSYTYGKKKLACARSDFAIAEAQRAGVLQAWLDALYARYNHEKYAASDTGGRLDQATSLDDLDAFLQDLTQSGPPRNPLAERRSELGNLSEKYRGSFRSRTGRLWAAQHLAPMQLAFFLDELSDHALEGALLAAVDGMKARLLFDYLTTPFQGMSSPQAAAQAVEMEQQILHFNPEAQRDERNMVLHEMHLVSELPIGLAFEDAFDPRSKAQRMQRLDTLEGVYASQEAGFASATMPEAYESIASALQPDEAILEYYLPSNHDNPVQQVIFIIVITHEHIHVQQSLLKRDPAEQWMAATLSVDGRQPVEESLMGERVMTLRLAIQEGNDTAANDCLQAFHDLLIAPVLELGLRLKDFRRWIIVPHATLHMIPFPALRSPEGRYLIEEVALTIAPSASIWHRLQAAARPPATSFAGFANPLLLNPDLPPLPEAESEVERICRGLSPLKCASFVAEEATETNVREQAPGKSIVHFATHGDFPENDVIDLHRIILAPTPEHDGRLNAEEIRQMDLHAARLVALSICDGGLYRVGPGDEPYGLIPALLTAGAENVAGTLWPLEDHAGREFMVEFYKHILKAGPAEAYRCACTRFLQENKPLRDWAGWVLIGPGRPWQS